MKTFSINNTKIANVIPKYHDLPKTRNIISVNTRGTKRKDIQFVITRDLTRFDMAVADAVYSLDRQGIKKITARKILLAISGDEYISVPKDRKIQVETVIEKLMDTEIYISCKEEANQTVAPYYAGKFLDAVRDTNGYKIQGNKPMPLYAYGEDKRHMITVPWELFQYRPDEGRGTTDKIINSKENMLLKCYLVRQLEIIRNGRNKVEEKTFQIKSRAEIFENLEIDTKSFTEESLMNKIRDIYRKMELILEYWVRIGYIIKDYETDKKEYSFTISQDMLCDNIFKSIKKQKESAKYE